MPAYGKANEESANPLRVVQILANIAHLAFGDNAFGMFQNVQRQRFNPNYEGSFRHAHGRPPFVGVSECRGQTAFSNNEAYVVNVTNRRALPMEPLILWEHCQQHPDLENGHCYLVDTNEGDGTFSYKAVGFPCTLKVMKDAAPTGLADTLSAIFDKDLSIDEIKV